MRTKATAKAKAKTAVEPIITTRVRDLTPREIEVIHLIWEEYSAKEIGLKLDISPPTVEAHRWNIARKLRAKSSVGIVKFALMAGIIKLPES